MNQRKLGLAAFLFISTTIPASADFVRVGAVDITHQRDRDTKMFSLDGPVERFRFEAERSDLECRGVDARFANGQTRRIFHGRIREGRDVSVDLPGDARNVRSLTFLCRADERRGGRIRISADIGPYRQDWQRSPRWGSVWSKLFDVIGQAGPNRMRNDAERWQPVGRELFSRRDDTERVSVGFRGRHIETIALRAQGADARCSSVVADFGNGRRRALTRSAVLFLPAGQFTQVDLPGNERTVDGLRLRCRPVRARSVEVGIFVR